MTGNLRVFNDVITQTLEARLYIEDAILELIATADEDIALVEWYGVEDDEDARQILRTTFLRGIGDVIPIVSVGSKS